MARRAKDFPVPPKIYHGALTGHGEWGVDVGTAGVPVCIGAKVVPPYVKPGLINFEFEAMGKTFPTNVYGQSFLYIAGYCVPMSELQTGTEDATDATAIQLFARYVREEIGGTLEDFDVNLASVPILADFGLPDSSAEGVNPNARRHLLVTARSESRFTRLTRLGLPKHGIVIGSNVYYFDSGSFALKPNPKSYDLSQPHLVVFIARQDEPNVGSDWSTALFGSPDNVHELREDLVLELQEASQASQIGQGVGLSTSAKSWLSATVNTANYEAETLQLVSRMTITSYVSSPLMGVAGKPHIVASG